MLARENHGEFDPGQEKGHCRYQIDGGKPQQFASENSRDTGRRIATTRTTGITNALMLQRRATSARVGREASRSRVR